MSDIGFVCESEHRSSCAGESFFQEHEGTKLCVLHYPSKGKDAPFNEALKRKVNTNTLSFAGVDFPDTIGQSDFASLSTSRQKIDFSYAIFNAEVAFKDTTFAAETSFSHAVFNAEADFSGAIFEEETNFSHATFAADVSFRKAQFLRPESARSHYTDFSNATFQGAHANFSTAEFHGSWVDFTNAIFDAEPSFIQAKFTYVDFRDTQFNMRVEFVSTTFEGRADFVRARFKEAVRFSGNWTPLEFGKDASLRLDAAEVEKPEQFSFHNVALVPHWFVNIDVRKFEFSNVTWNLKSIRDEIKQTQIREVPYTGPTLSITYRQLAANAEEHQRYNEASRFRYWAMDVLRREKWRGWAVLELDWWYWAVSGYGEKASRAIVWLVGIWASFALLYWNAPFVERTPKPPTAKEPPTFVDQIKLMDIGEASLYSLGVLSLQKPEPRAVNESTKALVNLEAILGPLEAALLALAIRRRYMR
jgi:uncharacterized protein YjbI with pentapeptide repeats